MNLVSSVSHGAMGAISFSSSIACIDGVSAVEGAVQEGD
jgi:hypothetical protein